MTITRIANAERVIAYDQAADTHVYRDGIDVVFDESRILHVGSGYQGTAGTSIDGRGVMVMPGLVNVHSHPSSEAGNKGLTDEIGSPKLYNSSLYEYLWLFRADGEGIPHLNHMSWSELLMSGVTTLVDLSFPSAGWVDRAASSGLRLVLAPMYRNGRWFTRNGYHVEYELDDATGRTAMEAALAFAAQHAGMQLPKVVADYAALAQRGAVIDYAFHLIIADPTPETIAEHLPSLLRQGHASVKVFMSYDRLRVEDEGILDILATAREHNALVCFHAENHGMIAWMVKRLLDRGYTAPKYHAISHPRVSEREAFERLFAMSTLVDQPIMIFHVSTEEGAAAIRRARGEGVKVYAETCPQYLFLTKADLDKPGVEGAKLL